MTRARSWTGPSGPSPLRARARASTSLDRHGGPGPGLQKKPWTWPGPDFGQSTVHCTGYLPAQQDVAFEMDEVEMVEEPWDDNDSDLEADVDGGVSEYK